MSQESQTSLLGNLRKVITLVDQLRDIGLNDYIKLPRIVVLGIQSAGKSSLLEHIVGIDFLPRGSGVVTRRPLELRLSYSPQSVCAQPTAEFVEEIKGKKYTNFDEVRKSIEDLTDKVCGTSKNIIDKPIILAVTGPNCPDLTLVDLPGITRIPIMDQPKDIEQITTNMARRYCEDPSAIILCVVAANADMTTSDALLLAKKLDPDGIRTVGVLTKIDIMDQGTNAIKMLKGEEVPLKYGYVGVKLRSQQEIKDNVPIVQAVQREKNFFANHPVYSSIPGDIFGTQVLTGKLTRILYRRIRSFLPTLMQEINQRISKVQNRLDILGPGLPIEDSDKLHYIWQLIHEFSVRYRNSISGQYEKQKANIKSLQVPAGSSIKLLFKDLYDDYSQLDYCALKKFKDEDILQVIQKYQAQSIPGFLPVDAFYALLNPELKKLYAPAYDTLEQAFQILEQYATTILESQLQQLPSVYKMLQDQIMEVIHECKKNAHDSITDVLDAEQNYIFTNDFNYLSGKPFIKFGKESKADQQKGNPMVLELRTKIEHYFKLVVRATRDNIPKLIGYFLVKGCQNQMLRQLQQNLMQNQTILSVISEDQNVVEERKKLNREIETFKNAQKIIKRDPDLSEYILSTTEEQEDQQYIQKQKQQTSSASNQQNKPQQQTSQQQQQQQQQQQATTTKQQTQQVSTNNNQQNKAQTINTQISNQRTDVIKDQEQHPQRPNDPIVNRTTTQQPDSNRQQPSPTQPQQKTTQPQTQPTQQNQQPQNNYPLNNNKPTGNIQPAAQQQGPPPAQQQQQTQAQQPQQEKKSLFGFMKK
ncbi:unnamed protein product [Paramecium octaurelia]|uniref:Dynamin-like protein n=1 Tax=Paramecium octaurelia TaxID=43137 RepID=A0A8S1SAD8_PAROT|nr:unnamed protein product [Paramecium octaurelia]